MSEWIAFDTETTGLEAGSRLIELAAVRFDPEEPTSERLDTFSALADPGQPVPTDATAINGIGDADLRGAEPVARVVARFLEWAGTEAIWCAHNAPFDVGVLGYELLAAGLEPPAVRVVDSRFLAARLGETADNRLQTIVEHHGWPRLGEAHRALPDADHVRRLVLRAWQQGVSRRLFRGRPFVPRQRPVAALPEALEALPAVIGRGGEVDLVYGDAWGRSSRRVLVPFGLAEHKGRVLFHGWCRLSGARRSFRADRVIICRSC